MNVRVQLIRTLHEELLRARARRSWASGQLYPAVTPTGVVIVGRQGKGGRS